jgi:hypothetical protein
MAAIAIANIVKSSLGKLIARLRFSVAPAKR